MFLLNKAKGVVVNFPQNKQKLFKEEFLNIFNHLLYNVCILQGIFTQYGVNF